jgi:hypothetical protein
MPCAVALRIVCSHCYSAGREFPVNPGNGDSSENAVNGWSLIEGSAGFIILSRRRSMS